jgi:hypothetical protein
MSDNQGASSQAGQQAQGSGSQGSQGGQSSQQQSFSEQVFGQAQQGSGTQSGTEGASLLPGQNAGESLADYAARMTSELTRARQDAGRYRTELRKYQPAEGQQGAQGQQAGAQGNDLSAITAEIATLKQELENERNARKSERTTTTLISALAQAGAVNPSRAARLIDTSTEVELAADGTPTPESVSAAIAKLKADTPGIFSDVRGSGDGGAGNIGQQAGTDFNDLIRQRARR